MKNAKLIPAFLILLFLFSGCTLSQNETETTLVSAFSQTTTVPEESTLAETTEISDTEATQTVTQPSSSSTTESTTQALTTAITTAVTSTSAVSAPAEESTSKEPQTTEKTDRPLSTKPSKAEDKTTTKKETTEKSSSQNFCTVTITCTTIYQNRSMLKKGKENFVPESGVILDSTEVTFHDGDTAFDVIKKACAENVCTDNCKYCQKNGIQLEYNYTPAFGTYYVEGVHQLYEKDCGSMSGWMFSVNGNFPNEGSSSYTVKAGDSIVFAYTCDMGDDVGNVYE